MCINMAIVMRTADEDDTGFKTHGTFFFSSTLLEVYKNIRRFAFILRSWNVCFQTQKSWILCIQFIDLWR